MCGLEGNREVGYCAQAAGTHPVVSNTVYLQNSNNHLIGHPPPPPPLAIFIALPNAKQL
jgi:hypothetical protein